MIGRPAFWASGDWATASWLDTDPKAAATSRSAMTWDSALAGGRRGLARRVLEAQVDGDTLAEETLVVDLLDRELVALLGRQAGERGRTGLRFDTDDLDGVGQVAAAGGTGAASAAPTTTGRNREQKAGRQHDPGPA